MYRAVGWDWWGSCHRRQNNKSRFEKKTRKRRQKVRKRRQKAPKKLEKGGKQLKKAAKSYKKGKKRKSGKKLYEGASNKRQKYGKKRVMLHIADKPGNMAKKVQ